MSLLDSVFNLHNHQRQGHKSENYDSIAYNRIFTNLGFLDFLGILQQIISTFISGSQTSPNDLFMNQIDLVSTFTHWLNDQVAPFIIITHNSLNSFFDSLWISINNMNNRKHIIYYFG